MTPRLNILFLLPDLPFPVSDGMRQKTFHLLEILSMRHSCDVISFYSEGQEQLEATRKALPGVNFLTAISMEAGLARSFRTVINLARLQPPSFARFQNPDFIKKVIQATGNKRYDVIHYDIINMAQFKRYLPSIPSVHSPNDATSLCSYRRAQTAITSWQNIKLIIAAKMLDRYERRNYGSFSKIHVVSKHDAEYLSANLPLDSVEYIPLGITGLKNLPQAAKSNKFGKLLLVLGESNLEHVSAGLMDFMNDAAPELLSQLSDLTIQLHGKGTREVISGHPLSTDQRIIVSSWVDDLNQLIFSADVVVLPDKSGTGVKTRLLQAMACGSAVVGTRAAFEGIGDFVKSGTHCIIVDSSSGIAGAAAQLLLDREACLRIGVAASAMINENFTWEALSPRYERLYFAAIERGCL